MIPSLPGAIAAAESNRDALTGRRREVLLAGTDDDRLKLASDIEAAELLLDKLRMLAEELDARLAQAREAESNAARARRRAELVLERDRAADVLHKDYPRHATAIAALIEKCLRSKVAIDEFNRTAPADEKIQDAETIVRHRTFAPRQEIKRQIVKLWCPEGESRPIPEELQAQVQDNGGGRGSMQPSPGCIGSARLFVRRKFERIEFGAAEQIVYAPPLAVATSLPALVSGEKHLDASARGNSRRFIGCERSRARVMRRPPFVQSKSSFDSLTRTAANDAALAATARAIEETRRAVGAQNQQRVRLLVFAADAFVERLANGYRPRGVSAPQKDVRIYLQTYGGCGGARAFRSCGEQSRRSNGLRTRGLLAPCAAPAQRAPRPAPAPETAGAPSGFCRRQDHVGSRV